MIFDNETVTGLVIRWKEGEESVLGEILEKSRSLIEAVVSMYDPIYREDLIQESYVKLCYALRVYDDDYSLHTYVTTVVHNICKTWMKKRNREILLDADIERSYVYEDNEDILHDVLMRNRYRFPSIPASILDELTEFIYVSLVYGYTGKSRGIISTIKSQYCLSRNTANTVYYSTVIYLRGKMVTNANNSSCTDEFSLASDLKEFLGDDDLYSKLSTVFSGLTIHFD